MPSSVKDPDRAAAIMSYWSYLSHDTVVDAFYEITLTYKRLNAPEDSDMLDLIRDSMRYEISTVWDMGITSIVAGTGQGSGLASAYQKRKSVIERKLNEVSQKYARFNP